MCMVHAHAHVYARAHGGQEKISDPLELELKIITWVLGTKLPSSARAANTL